MELFFSANEIFFFETAVRLLSLNVRKEKKKSEVS